MSLIRLLSKVPRWVYVLIGCGIGIAVLSLLLRNALVTGEETSLPLFAGVHFAGYLFFFISPVELLYLHMLNGAHSHEILWGVAMGTALVAQGIDYVIGYACSNTVIKQVIGEKKYRRNLRHIERFGSLTIFIFCLLPLSSPIVVLVAGMIRYPFRWVMIFSVTGLAIKYMALTALFNG